jgi:AGZA family xanthine/uracil permease-like MFS transporter
MRMSGLIKDHPTNLVALGDLHSPPVILTLVGLFTTLICISLNIPAALFIGMVVTGIIAYLTGQLHFDKGFIAVPSIPEPIVLNPIQAVSDVIQFGLYGAVFSFLLVTLFDTTGTFLGVSKQAGLTKGDETPNSSRAMLSDSIASLVGSIFGTSPTSAYIESASGVTAGGRTGFTAVVVAIMFAICAFFSPLMGSLTGVAAITSPALIIVGSMMISHVRYLNWDHYEESFPAFLVILSMPLTSSIATGISLGFITYPIMKVLKGKWKEVHPLIYVFAVLFVIQLIFVPH